MKQQLKRLDEQVVVITGASSGIGLVTARMAAKRGAKLVLTARSEDALAELVREITTSGGEAIHVAGDVGEADDVRRVAATAIERFGGFDTWVNDAGVSIYGRLLEVPLEDARRLFDTNFWGIVHGSLEAARHLRTRGGALINVGSTVSDRAIPLQGIYSASKHAVKGFTDALRMELEEEGAPVSVTLIKPGSIDTPYPKHARNYLEEEPTLPPPVYAPEVVADAILYAAENPVRDLFAGGGGKALSAMGHYAPRLTDRMMEATMFRMQKKDEPAHSNTTDGLYTASGSLEERGGSAMYVSESSLYTKATEHPLIAGAVVAGVGFALAGLLRGSNR